jgi:hypothetical protein
MVGVLASRAFFDGESLGKYYSDFSISRARHGIDAAVSNVLGSLDLSVSCILGAACLAVIVWRWTSFPPRARAALIGTAWFGLAWLVIFSANRWVEINLFYYRYFFPLYAAGMLVAAGATAEVVALAQRSVHRRTRLISVHPSLPLACASALMATGVVGVVLATDRTNVHVLDAAEDDVERARTLDIRLITGDYWSTWPAVVAGRAEGIDLLAVAQRSNPIMHEINDEIDQALSTSGVVRALCPSNDLEQCTGVFASLTERQWAARAISADGPLVIDLRPVP